MTIYDYRKSQRVKEKRELGIPFLIFLVIGGRGGGVFGMV